MQTTRQILLDLQKMLVDWYSKELARLPLKPKDRDLLIDGFRDGCREGVNHTIAMLEVEIKEEAGPAREGS